MVNSCQAGIALGVDNLKTLHVNSKSVISDLYKPSHPDPNRKLGRLPSCGIERDAILLAFRGHALQNEWKTVRQTFIHKMLYLPHNPEMLRRSSVIFNKHFHTQWPKTAPKPISGSP